MKFDGIKRSVRANRYDRAAGDAPGLGRVAKMPGVGLPQRERRRRRRSDDGFREAAGRDHPSSVIALTLWFSALAVVLLGGVVWMWLLPNMHSRDQPASIGAEMADLPETPSPSEPEALALVKRALSIRNPAEVGEYFRPGASSPSAIIEFLKNLESIDGKVVGYQWLSSMDVNRLYVDGVTVSFTKENVSRNRLALLTPDAKGRWVVDFDAFARTVTPSWEDLIGKRANIAQVRVHIAKDSYYNGLFKDETQWICYGMASPDTDGILLGYCKVGSPQAAAIEWIFSNKDNLNRATLEIRRVESAESRQFEISKVIAEDWIVGDRAFDEGF